MSHLDLAKLQCLINSLWLCLYQRSTPYFAQRAIFLISDRIATTFCALRFPSTKVKTLRISTKVFLNGTENILP